MIKRINQIEPWVDKEEEKEVLSVLRSGWITEDSKTREFEKLIGKFVNAKYTSVVANGTVSLAIGLIALGIKKSDEVIVPDFTMVASPNAVVLAGARPVLVDIDRKTLCIDIEELKKKITPKTKVIMSVSLNGRSSDMKKIIEIARKQGIFVLEDAAQALGSYCEKKHLGTWGDIGSFSFSTPKVITTGQGGALVTNDKSLWEKIIRIKDFGRLDRSTQNHDELGYNFKFTDILAAVGVAQMKKLSWRLKRKKEMYKKYQEFLRDIKEVQFIETNLDEVSPWFIDIIVPDPIKLKIFLKNNGVGTREFYPAVHMTKPYKGNEKFPNSLWASTHGLWLPSSSFLSDSDIECVCSYIKKFYE